MTHLPSHLLECSFFNLVPRKPFTSSSATPIALKTLYHKGNWRASEASATLSGVTQLKIGDICYRASEASEILLVMCLSTNGERALKTILFIYE